MTTFTKPLTCFLMFKVSESLQVNLVEQEQVLKKLEHLKEGQTSFCQKQGQLIDEMDIFFNHRGMFLNFSGFLSKEHVW